MIFIGEKLTQFFLTCFSTTVVFFLNKFTALPSSARIFVSYCIVETFALRVTAPLEDPKPVTSQQPCCLFEYFTWCVYLIINVNNINKINRWFVFVRSNSEKHSKKGGYRYT